MSKVINISIVILSFFLCVLLVIIVYPGHTMGIMYDIEGYKLHKLAEKGDASAQYSLGSHYEYPPIVLKANNEIIMIRQPDDQQAIVWYRKAAEQGYCMAQHKLGNCYREGKGVKKDLKQAILWLGKAAEQDTWFYQVELARLYNSDRNADNSIKQANWFRRGAEKGYPDCQYQLALCYQHGLGVKKDYKEAARWFRRGADEGNYDCQYQLGRCYAKGEGVGRDNGLAVFWYREAAEQGHEEAQKALKALVK